MGTLGKHWKMKESTKRKIGLANSISLKGRKLPENVKNKIRLSSLGKNTWMKGKKDSKKTVEKKRLIWLGRKHSIKSKKKMSEYRIEHPNKVFKDTKIELKIEEELKKRGINYQKQVPLCKIAIVDFYLPGQKIVIQADGCYYHGCPIHFPDWIKNKERDINQDIKLKSNDYNVYRFWEHEINQSVEDCIKRINIKN